MLHRDVIKGFHEKLRVRLADGTSQDILWEENTKNDKGLGEYSEAMHQLGLEWDSKAGGEVPERVKWIVDTAVRYFGTSAGGKRAKLLTDQIPGLVRLQLKEIKRSYFSTHNTPIPEDVLATETSNLLAALTTQFQLGNGLQLLDVGSCYNPSQKYASEHTINVTAVDLCPSRKCLDTVFACDFLNVKVGDNLLMEPYSPPAITITINDELESTVLSEDSIEILKGGQKRSLSQQESNTSGGQRITQLERNAYDVVTFCLLLSYFPCSDMRFKCLENAFRVLKTNGLLIIITTKTVGPKSLTWLKSWNKTLEMMGFVRAAQEVRHKIICLAYRKVSSDMNPHDVPEEMRKVPIGADQ